MPHRQLHRVVLTGGAGFIGSHLVDALIGRDVHVVCVDNLVTGRQENLLRHAADTRLTLVRHDVSETLGIGGDVDAVLHFASPASPVDYQREPVATLLVGTAGTYNALRLAEEKQARFMLASTSEVYGDPLLHPQVETHWGNVNPVGPRSMYDEAKRAAEAFVMAFHRSRGVDTRIARIFNTYGPRMRDEDGRAVPQFVNQALDGAPITVYGDGSQTRSLCYVDDLVDGLLRLLDADRALPVNLGNPHEVTMNELAATVRDICGSNSEIVCQPLPEDDPRRRRPDISVARSLLGWEPKVGLDDGLRRTVDWWRSQRETAPPVARASA
ncbi:MAG: SDR family oxidoreductase [Candidatus Dormibacteraeota bacterium]|nr:SDR family oxidoreductase [Candidatus Dormibacteraeota bacterium]MBV8444778.1 SDR family oxidoreductase [Candidatus Dormibacteraeota bacterium]